MQKHETKLVRMT